MAMGECICGTPLVAGTREHATKKKFRDSLSDELSDASLVMNSGLVAIREKANAMREQLASLSAQLVVLRDNRQSLDQALKDAKSKIQARTDLPDVPKLQIKKEHLDNRTEELIKHISALEVELQLKEEELKNKNAMLRALKVRQQQNDVADKQWM